MLSLVYTYTYTVLTLCRYEAASTIYGPHTLSAYIQQYNKLATALAKGNSVPPGPTTPNYMSKQITLLEGVLFDGGSPGRVVREPEESYKVNSVVQVVFETGHPKNNLLTNKTFLEVQCLSNAGNWEVVATDSEWETKLKWERTNYIEGKSNAIIEWDIPTTSKPGKYRIKHYGYRKHLLNGITPFSGVSRQFEVSD